MWCVAAFIFHDYFDMGVLSSDLAVVLGDIKGIWRVVVLLAVAVLVPCIALLVSTYTHDFLGLDFTLVFLLTLGLEALFAAAALFGIASEVERSHGEAIDQAAREQASR